MTPLSVVMLPVLLCSLPLGLDATVWLLELRDANRHSGPRIYLLRSGIILSALSVLIVASCYIDPYPLVHTLDGGLSTAWLDLAWEIAFAAVLASLFLAFFGKGWVRMILLLSGILTLLLEFGSILQNGV